MEGFSLDATQRLLRQLYVSQSARAAEDAQEQSQRELSLSLDAQREDDQDPQAYIRLARWYRASDRHDEAFEVLRRGLARCPSTLPLYRPFIDTLAEANRTSEALDMAEQASRLHPDDLSLRLRRHLLLPIVYSTPSELDTWRGRFSAGLEELTQLFELSAAERRKAWLEAIAGHGNFYLPYQGRNDLDLQRQYGRLVSRVMGSNYSQWVERPPMPQIPSDGRLRVGYVSARFGRHSVSKTHAAWLLDFDRKVLRVYAYSIGAGADALTDRVRHASEFRDCRGGIEATCKAIVADRLHALVFLDVGMTPAMMQLAALRLAPFQCVTWGHPVTTGLDTIDCFLSSELMEPADGEHHYAERLIRLPGIGICYEKPVIPSMLLDRSRSKLGIREDAVVYLACQSTFKYLPQHDHIFAEIASQVPAAQFVFLVPNRRVGADFSARLNRAFSAVGLDSRDRCLLLPQQDFFSYWNLNLVSDVYLDSIDWSGCNSTMEAIACRLPIVTMPGQFMRGRHSYAMLTQLDVTETIAKAKREYVSIAVKLGLDRTWRQTVIDQMVANYDRLYSDLRSVRALEDLYRRTAVDRGDRRD
jgi:predicted O-linked N-acetylglucosamine transferase (SPINDLY family)